jgi:hypothetical protein
LQERIGTRFPCDEVHTEEKRRPIWDAAAGESLVSDAVNPSLLFTPSLHGWLPEVHLARFLVDVVAALNQSAICSFCEEQDGRG